MSALMQQVWDRALEHRVPLSVQFDLTYRCNERCVHCYLDHDDHGELTTAEVKHVLDQLAAAGTLVPDLQRRRAAAAQDFFELLAYARALGFDVKLKTNAILIGEREAERIRDLGVRRCRSASTRTGPRSTTRSPRCRARSSASIAAIRFLRARGLQVLIANVLMRQNAGDYPDVQALAAELGVSARSTRRSRRRWTATRRSSACASRSRSCCGSSRTSRCCRRCRRSAPPPPAS